MHCELLAAAATSPAHLVPCLHVKRGNRNSDVTEARGSRQDREMEPQKKVLVLRKFFNASDVQELHGEEPSIIPLRGTRKTWRLDQRRGNVSVLMLIPSEPTEQKFASAVQLALAVSARLHFPAQVTA